MSWVLPVVTQAFSIMETVAFIQFIEEEAIQSASLGVFLAIRQRNYRAAWTAIHLRLHTSITNQPVDKQGGPMYRRQQAITLHLLPSRGDHRDPPLHPVGDTKITPSGA